MRVRRRTKRLPLNTPFCKISWQGAALEASTTHLSLKFLICLSKKPCYQTHGLGRSPTSGRPEHSRSNTSRESLRRYEQRSLGVQLLRQVWIQQYLCFWPEGVLDVMKILLRFNQFFTENTAFSAERAVLYCFSYIHDTEMFSGATECLVLILRIPILPYTFAAKQIKFRGCPR